MKGLHMKSELHHQQRSMVRFLLVHLLLVIALPFFFTLFGGAWDYLITLLVTALVLALIDYRYGLYLFWSVLFLIYLVKEIIISNFVMAWLVIQPKPKLDPGIIAVPLTVTTGLEITVLSLAIAVTPGTLIIELGTDASGCYVLYVHNINVGDPDQFRAAIQNGFERMILKISRGATA
jgi:multicomponent Na+:H+ antiporter subunit E